MYQCRVSYAYAYNDIDYTNEHASLGGSVASTSRWLVRKIARRYTRRRQSQSLGQSRLNPSQATLEPRASHVWVLWASAAAIWGVAYYAAVHG